VTPPVPPFVTAGLPGSGGTLKASPEDFRVDELPAYLPSGAGPHLYLLVEKRGRTTRDVLRELAGRLGVAERDAGCAGLKDREAVTTQWLSFPVARDPEPGSLAGAGLRVVVLVVDHLVFVADRAGGVAAVFAHEVLHAGVALGRQAPLPHEFEIREGRRGQDVAALTAESLERPVLHRPSVGREGWFLEAAPAGGRPAVEEERPSIGALGGCQRIRGR